MPIADDIRLGKAAEMVALDLSPLWGSGVSFIANEDNEHVVSAVRKITNGPIEEGSIIFLTADEFEAITNPDEFRAFLTGVK